jgi:hypothetical protein
MLNPLAQESNVQSSLKKFFVDVFGDAVTFDISLASPDLRKRGPDAIKRWYNVDFGEFGRRDLSEYMFDVYCLSRQDLEGVELAKMADTVMSLLVDSSKTDGLARVPLYDTSKSPWELLTSMVVQDVWDAPVLNMAEDETKIKILSVRLRWGTSL